MRQIIREGYLFSNPDSAKYYAHLQYEFAREVQDDYFIADALNSKGISYYFQSESDSALKYYFLSLDAHNRVNNQKGISGAYNNIGAVYQDLGNFDQAIVYYAKSLKIEENIGNKMGISGTLNNIGIIYQKLDDDSLAMGYFRRCLEIDTEIQDKSGIKSSVNNIGLILARNGDYEEALGYFNRSLKLEEEMGDQYGIATSLYNIAGIYKNLEQVDTALVYYYRALDIRQNIKDQIGISECLISMGSIFKRKGETALAIDNFLEALELGRQYGAQTQVKDAAEALWMINKKLGDYPGALEMHELYVRTRDSLESITVQKTIIRTELGYKYEKQKALDNAEYVKQLAVGAEVKKRQKLQIYFSIGALILSLIFGGVIFSRYRITKNQKKIIEKERNRSEELLLNILPAQTADELKRKGYVEPQNYDLVSVLFTDFKGFTRISEGLKPKELLAEINLCFQRFDEIITSYGIEKIKTIGDAYMAAGGLPERDPNKTKDVINAAIDIRDFMVAYRAELLKKGEEGFEIRIGIHSGPVVAGIVGIKKFAYDIWGDVVNTASRIESSGVTGKVNISGTTQKLVANDFAFEYRGKVPVKNKDDIEMYFVERKP